MRSIMEKLASSTQSHHQTTKNLLHKKNLLKALRNLKLKCFMLHTLGHMVLFKI